MPLVNLVIALIVVGMALWLINRFIPMQSGIKMILNVVVVVAVGDLGVAGYRIMGTDFELSNSALRSSLPAAGPRPDSVK